MSGIVSLRPFGASDPLADDGRLDRIRDVCALGGVPRISMYLFEAGCSPDVVTIAIARALGVQPALAPFPDLIADPFPRDDD